MATDSQVGIEIGEDCILGAHDRQSHLCPQLAVQVKDQTFGDIHRVTYSLVINETVMALYENQSVRVSFVHSGRERETAYINFVSVPINRDALCDSQTTMSRPPCECPTIELPVPVTPCSIKLPEPTDSSELVSSSLRISLSALLFVSIICHILLMSVSL